MPRGHISPQELKDKVRSLRLQEKSFNEITRETGVVRSTLHEWLKDIARPEKYKDLKGKEWMDAMREMAVVANKKKYGLIYSEISNRAKKESDKAILTTEFKKGLLSMLYWAEGTKGEHASIIFANTDPVLIRLFVVLFRECYKLDENKFHVRIHLHNYHDEKKVKKFWSDLLEIPLEKFGKVYWKERSKEKTYRRNFGGICFVRYNSVYLRREIMDYGTNLAKRLVGKIYFPNVPVA